MVHEEEDGEEEGGDAGQKVDVPEFSSSKIKQKNVIDELLKRVEAITRVSLRHLPRRRGICHRNPPVPQV